jgi:hypothetical protein
MFGLSAKLPVSEEKRQWVDQGFQRLEKMLGPRRMLEAKVVLPTAEDFPDPYNKTPAAVEKLFQRLCTYMQLDRNAIELEICPDETEALRKTPHTGEAIREEPQAYTHMTPPEKMKPRSAWLLLSKVHSSRTR